MDAYHASAKAVCLLLLGCSPEPIAGPEITIVAHQLDVCPLPNERGQFDLEALGDFAPASDTSDTASSDDRNRALAFPAHTLAVSATASFERSSERFTAIADYSRGRHLPMLFWPAGRSCELGGTNTYPAPGGGQGLGFSRERSLLLVVGSDASQSAAVAGALTFHTGTGESQPVPPGSSQLREPRAFPSVTPFGPGFLVAGGEDPTLTFPSGRRRLRETAEVFVAADNGFAAELSVQLQAPRTRHAAVALSSGVTLLLGGLTASDAGEQLAIPTLELVAEGSARSSHAGLMQEPRISPGAVQLSETSLFVANGHDIDGKPLAGAEFIDGSPSEGFTSEVVDADALPARSDRDLTRMPGGGVLLVGGCEDRTGSDQDCSMCRRGCMPEQGWDAFWVSDRRQVTRIPLRVPVPRPRLIPGADGAPYLVTGDPASQRALLRFDPWSQEFFDALELEAPPSASLPLSGLDLGAAAWIADASSRARLIGYRFSSRHELSHDLDLITLVSTSNARWPLHLAPGQGRSDRATAAAELVPEPDDEHSGGGFVLELRERASVWITDTVYADFWLELQLVGRQPPGLLLGTPTRRCSWPDPGSSGSLLRATRTGPSLLLSNGDSEAPCSIDTTERLAVGFEAGVEPVLIRRLRITRSR